MKLPSRISRPTRFKVGSTEIVKFLLRTHLIFEKWDDEIKSSFGTEAGNNSVMNKKKLFDKGG